MRDWLRLAGAMRHWDRLLGLLGGEASRRSAAQWSAWREPSWRGAVGTSRGRTPPRNAAPPRTPLITNANSNGWQQLRMRTLLTGAYAGHRSAVVSHANEFQHHLLDRAAATSSTSSAQTASKPAVDPLAAGVLPKISVVGVGGAGGNAVNNMIASSLSGVEFVVTNTDAQALSLSLSRRCVQLGAMLTEGLGAGARPDVGRAAAEESFEAIKNELRGSHMVFVTAGMGGGTGSGAAPVVARAAAELGCLTVGVVTTPFLFEGAHRAKVAQAGIAEISQCVDTLIVIPNQNLFKIANARTTMMEAFRLADQVLYSGVRSVTDLMTVPGLVNLDFADVRSVMSEMGKAMMGTGEVEMEGGSEERAVRACEAAVRNPLLDDASLRGARGVLVNITGGPDMTLFEVDAAAHRVREEVDADANIIFGSAFDESMLGKLRVSVVATGIP
ncbi:hypothetical protein CDCA_CDCA06G1850 [Cyanidium caldarium]|uniref:Uncharacterized protein n=1 Tax=Cyanidium caldarium TaxID=2771 RepID=A0AAV9IUR1_CYACA|nr:hypothetical protein CDCA_CDCA06G1850 [Cyanidium caldarium]